MLADLLIALVIAVGVSALFWGFTGARRPRAWGEALGIFVLALLVTWAAGAWLAPVGPFFWGGYWLPFLITGLLFLLLLVALLPARPPRTVQEAVDQAQAETAVAETAFVVLSVFFWLLVAALLAAIVAAYV